MEYALILGVMIALVGVKAFTMYSLGQLEKDVHDLKSEDQEVQAKIDALDGTRTQLERENKDILSEIEKLDNTKNQLVVSIQKFGAMPVEEPSARGPAPVDARAPEPPDSEPEPVEEAEDEAVGEAAVEGETAETGDPVADPENREDGEDPIRILIVDDNLDLRDLLTEALSRDYVVDRAADGLEALHLMIKQGRKYAVVLTDLNMPNIDGATLIEKMPEETQVIVMSAYLARPEFVEIAEHPRVFRTIGKPFRLGDVRDAVTQLVETLRPGEPVVESSEIMEEEEKEEPEEQLQE